MTAISSKTATAPPARPSFTGCLPTMRCRSMKASRRCRRSRPRQLGERQIGYDARSGLRAGIDDRFIAAAEHAFHGLQIHALAGHVRRLLVLIVNLEEARGLAGGFGDGLLAIGFGVLGYFGGAAARLRNDPIGVSLRLILRSLEIRARRLYVAEGIDHLRAADRLSAVAPAAPSRRRRNGRGSSASSPVPQSR